MKEKETDKDYQIKKQKNIVCLKDIVKNYYTKGGIVEVLKKLNFIIKEGDMISIKGPSGAGKTTLLNIIGSLDKPEKGTVNVCGYNLMDFSEKECVNFRLHKIGFVFQQHCLLPQMTLLENVLIPTIPLKTKSFNKFSLNSSSDNCQHNNKSLNSDSDNSKHSYNSLNTNSTNSQHSYNSLNTNSTNSQHSYNSLNTNSTNSQHSKNLLNDIDFKNDLLCTNPIEKAKELISKINLTNRMDFFPEQLSLGEQQRVSVVRALINSPQLILADEPTGSLDKKRTRELMELLCKFNEEGITVIVVTHSDFAASWTKKIWTLEDGIIF